MALTEDQLKTLSARAMFDAEFRMFLLARPKEAAKQLGMKLSKKDEMHILAAAERISARGARADRALAKLKGIIIIFSAAPTPVKLGDKPATSAKLPPKKKPKKEGK